MNMKTLLLRPVPLLLSLLLLALAPLCLRASQAPSGADPAARSEDADILFEPTTQIPAQGGPGVREAFFSGGSGLLSGGIGTLAVGDGVGLGVGGYSLASEYAPLHNGIRHDFGYSYGGLLVDYSASPRHLLYFNASVMVGPAQGWSVARTTGADRVYVNFAQIEPGISVMLNVTHELRVGVGASWRYCAGADLNGLLGSDLSGGAISLILMYGKI
jgi:hypothetical protein